MAHPLSAWAVEAQGQRELARCGHTPCQHVVKIAKTEEVMRLVAAQVQVGGADGRCHGLFEQKQAWQPEQPKLRA